MISSNVKVAAAGASLDVPLGHKDDSWSFPHFDTITVSVADAPRPDEILVVMAMPTAEGFGTDVVPSQSGDSAGCDFARSEHLAMMLNV